MKKIIFLLMPLICVLLLVSCDMASIQDKMEQMSENLKDKIIDVAGPYIEKDTGTDIVTDEVLDNDSGSKPSDIPSDTLTDIPSDIPSDIPTDTENGGTVDPEPDTPVIPEIPEYVVLTREKYPLNKYIGLDIFKSGEQIKDNDYKFRTAYGYGRYETALDDLMGANPITYCTISGMLTSVSVDFDLSKAKLETSEGELSFGDISAKIHEFAKSYCNNSLISNLTRIEIGVNPDTTISASDYALLLNIIYDNNCKQNGADGENKGTTFINNQIRLITGKMSSYNLPYIKELMEQIDLLRDDEYLPIGGWSFSVNTKGKTPEEIFANNQELKDLIAYRNEYYNSIEIYLSDFGWDTVNTESELYVSPTDKYTSEEIQAMYILRSFLILQGMDVDKASYDLLNDTEEKGHGLIDKNGNKKLSFTILEYFKSKLDGMYLAQVVSSGEKNLYCYKFVDGNGKTVYAYWSADRASINLFNMPEAVKVSYYDTAAKSYVDTQETISNGLYSNVADGCVTFVEY